jgi:hypothetical protein
MMALRGICVFAFVPSKRPVRPAGSIELQMLVVVPKMLLSICWLV